MRTFRYSSWIEAPVADVFAFHEQPGALERLTPPKEKLEKIQQTNGIEPGSQVVVAAYLGPFRVTWHALHTAYEKDRLFVDEQEKGPFQTWIHRHEFAEENGGTRLTDFVRYELKGGRAVGLLAGWFVTYQLNKMFKWRHKVTKESCEKT